MIEETTAITIFMKCKVLISLVILRTLNALRILTALSAERLPPPLPKAISTILVLTTKASKRFIISAKKVTP